MVTIVLVVYVAVVLIAFLFSDRLIFLPSESSYSKTSLPVVMAPVDGDSIALLHLPNPAARYTILFSHGNAEDLGDVASMLYHLHNLGFGVLAYDYRGYGLSRGGHASARKANRDIEAAYRYAMDELHIPADRIVVYGRSVGSGPTLDLASRARVAGVVLESAFTNIYTLMTRVPLVPFDKFPNLRHLRDVKAPVLVIHGTADEVVPFGNGRRLFASARGPKQSLFVEGAHHNNVAHVAGRRYDDALHEFARLLDETSTR